MTSLPTRTFPKAATTRAHFPHLHWGFTLIELLVVLVIVALGSSVAALAMRDSQDAALSRDAERLAALLEAARAQSRVAGVPVFWRVSGRGFTFEGLPPTAQKLPSQWLNEQTVAIGNAPLLLGPDPIIGAQAVLLHPAGRNQPMLRVATDGLRPFHVERVQ